MGLGVGVVGFEKPPGNRSRSPVIYLLQARAARIKSSNTIEMPSVNLDRLLQLLWNHHARIEDIIAAGRNQKIHAMLLAEQSRLLSLIDNLQSIEDSFSDDYYSE